MALFSDLPMLIFMLIVISLAYNIFLKLKGGNLFFFLILGIID
jgi:hypothetical protein